MCKLEEASAAALKHNRLDFRIEEHFKGKSSFLGVDFCFQGPYSPSLSPPQMLLCLCEGKDRPRSGAGQNSLPAAVQWPSEGQTHVDRLLQKEDPYSTSTNVDSFKLLFRRNLW